MKRLLLILIAISLLLTTVSAQQENFNAYGPVIIKTYQCRTSQFPITITNTGDITSTYYLEVDGNAAKWIKFAPATIVLNPGETAQAQSFLTAPCDAKGEYTLNVYIVTSYGLEKVIPQQITIDQPLNIDIIPKIHTQTIDPCQTAEYKITIINPDEFTDTYKLSTDSFKDQAKISQTEITLSANTTKDITLEITPQNCEQTGTHTIVFAAEAQKTGTIAEIDLHLEIKDSGIPVIAEEITQIKADSTQETAAEISVFNKGNNTKEYEIEVLGQTWITADTTSMTIEPQKSETIRLYIKPTEETRTGEHQIQIKATDTETGAEYTKEITIQLRKPTVTGKLFSEYLAYTIPGIILFILIIIGTYLFANKLTSKEYQIARAKRKKEREKKKAELKKAKAKLKAEKEKEKQRKQKELEKAKEKAIQKYEKQIRTDYELISKQEVAHGRKVPSNWLRNLILFFVILLLFSIAMTIRTTLWNNITYVLIGICILIALYILQKITRLNKKIARWRGIILAHQGLLMNIGWKKGLHQLSFKLNTPAKNIKITAKKGRTRHAKYVQPKDHVYKYFRINSNISNIDVKEAKYRFKISRKWLKKKEIKPDDVRLAALKAGHYTKIKTAREGADRKYIYYSAKTEGFGQFAIVGKTSRKEKKKQKTWLAWTALIILAVFATILIAILATTQTDEIQVKGIPSQSWQQDTQHTIDLTNYFNDPDGDTLEYEATLTENIDIQITNGMAYLTPDPHWSGQRIVTFTASDSRGGTAKSNPVQLTVQKTILPNEYTGYLKYVLVGVIILILLLTFLILKKPVMKWIEEE